MVHIKHKLTLYSLRVPIGTQRYNCEYLVDFYECLPQKLSWEDLLIEVIKL